MCGIAALVAAPRRTWSLEQLDTMRQCLHHRGPDASGLYTWPPSDASSNNVVVGLAHTRLAILDVSHGSDQPMRDAESSVALSFNGEIYNYIELREELKRAGHRFSTTGDTEVLLRAYLEWGTSCFQRLIGMYAFVVHDPRSRTVLAARDPFGIKPLYVADSSAGIALASELKAFRHLETVSHAVDKDTLLRYVRFASGQTENQTVFSGVREVGAGCYLLIDVDTATARTERHYAFRPQELTTQDLSFDEAARELRSRFLASVELHSRSDVAVGTALSGGIDSSSIIGGLRRVLGPGPDIHAFSYSAVDSPLDESAWAEQAALHSDAELHHVAPSPEAFAADIDDLVSAWDEPIPGTSVYAQYCIFRAAQAAGIKVLLDGQGADELLGGYDRYVGARIASLLRQGRWTAAGKMARAARARGLSLPGTVAMTADFVAPPRVQELVRPLVGRGLVPAWLDGDWFARGRAHLAPVHYTRSRHVLRDQLTGDLTRNGVPFLLRNEDRDSMIWSVESRVPFLIPDLAEFCVSLPEEYLVADDTTSKSVFRHAMVDVVPSAILARRDKIGFEAPAVRWFELLGEENRATYQRLAVETLPFLDRNHTDDLWRRAKIDPWSAEAAWRLIFLTKWARQRSIDFGL
jgi:asparagine synthase (glutamine-hydrolysing)